MQRIDRNAARDALEKFLDAHDRLCGCNSEAPDTLTEIGEAAMAAYHDLTGLIAIDLHLSRQGAIMHCGNPLGGVAHSREAIDLAREPMLSQCAEPPEGLNYRRRQVALFLRDHAHLLSPGVAKEFCTALLLLNLGEKPPLALPHRVKNMPNPKTGVLDAHLAFEVGYRHGWWKKARTVREILQDIAGELPAISVPDEDAFRKRLRRQNLNTSYDTAREQGAQDRDSGKPMNSGLTWLVDARMAGALAE